jgi:hypothetical protein
MGRVAPSVSSDRGCVRAVLSVGLAALFAATGLAACTGEITQGKDPLGEDGHVHPEVITADHQDVSPPLRDIVVAEDETEEFYENEPARPIPHSPLFFSLRQDATIQTAVGTAAAPATLANFEGQGSGFSGPSGTFTVQSAPPDTDGDVGPNHYVQIVNSSIAMFNKSGTAVYGPVPTSTLWSGFSGACANTNDGDGTVRYDRIADRWVIAQFSVNGGSGPFYQCVAVSKTGDPTGAYNRYQFSYTGFNDYPKMGLWPDGYYFTFNMFPNNSFAGGKVCAMDRVKMVAGATATMQCFDSGSNWGGLLAADLDGTTLPPAGAPNYVVALDSNALGYWKLHIDWTTPSNSTFTGPSTISVASYSPLCSGGTCVTQSGGTQQLDSLADRLMNRFVYRNFGDHETLLVSHSVSAGSKGGVRWYELRNPNSPTMFQQGTYAPDTTNYRWMSSIGIDKSGDIALGYSISGAVTPGIRYTGRLPTDAAGTMGQGEGTIISGGGSQNGGLSRWGDYSALNIDPSDDCTFWYTQEYMGGTGSFNWHTRIASFKFPNCGGTVANDFSVSANPTAQTVAAGASATIAIATAVTSGSAQSVALSVSGLPAGVTGSFSPASVTAGGGSTLTLTAASSASAGTTAFTITGTAGGTTHTVNAQVTVTTTANDFSVSVSPSSQTVAAGASTTFTVATAVASGSAQSITLSAAGLPAGATATFNPATVTAGASSTLTIAVAASAAAGTSQLTIKGTAGSTSHTAPAGLTVTTTTTSGLVNGNFESGLTGWTVGGSATTSTTVHGGAASAMVGSTSPTADSSIKQTFTMPANATTLSFFYRVTCPDTIQYDWATATLTDNVTGVATTILASTCTNTGAWVQSSATVSGNAGHSVTLTLLNHDDNYAGDATYTLFDDVTIGSGGGGNVLQNGVPVTGLSGALNAQANYTFVVPAGQTTATFKISGGTGDADIYVRFGASPTTTTYDYRPYLTGNTETVTVTNPTAGTWYVMVRAYAAYSGLTLQASYP